jgi:lysophospholipase L1-like esterase
MSRDIPRRAAFWLMLPLTAMQGLWLRRVATRLPGASGERRGSIGDGPDLHLLALGDSIIDGVGTGQVEHALPVQFAKHYAKNGGKRIHWRIEGLSGLAIRGVIERLNAIEDSYRADVVLISVGVNDVTGLTSTRRWRRGLFELLRTIDARWPGASVIFAGLPPMSRFPLPPQPLRFSLGLRAETLDAIASDVTGRFPNAIHIPTKINPESNDFCPDGFHPSAVSCNLWAMELVRIESGRGPQ